MAQKTEKEETEFKVPETLTSCVNNCGVTGNPATNNMCQKCFNATTATASVTTSSNNNSTNTTSTTTMATSSSKSVPISKVVASFSAGPILKTPRSRPSVRDLSHEKVTSSDREDTAASVAKKEVTRCSGCRRKVGLTGFRCRCGELFCWEHRYSDRHDCNYDYKAAGREAIARENPVVKAAKIVRV